MSDSKKSKEELIAELEALRAKVAQGEVSDSADLEAPSGGGLTRRDVVKSVWVAPVILSVPLMAGSERAHAQTPAPGSTATPAPPTSAPPSLIPTPAPTSTPGPTVIPTPRPTMIPTSVPGTSIPTAFPTATAGGGDTIPVKLSEFQID